MSQWLTLTYEFPTILKHKNYIYISKKREVVPKIVEENPEKYIGLKKNPALKKNCFMYHKYICFNISQFAILIVSLQVPVLTLLTKATCTLAIDFKLLLFNKGNLTAIRNLSLFFLLQKVSPKRYFLMNFS